MQSLWMLAAAFLFASMGVCVKLVLHTHSVWEVVFYRNLIGMFILLPLLMYRQNLRTGLSTPHWRQHITRNFSGTFAVILWFSSMAHLPLPTSMTLNYTSSLFIAAILLINARFTSQAFPTKTMLSVLMVGFVGILLILHPTLNNGQLPWAMVGLASGIFAAIALLSVRALGRLGEPEARTVFYFCLSGALIGLLGMLISGMHPLSLHASALMLGIGVFAVLAQLAITRAYGYGKTLLAANLNYFGIVFASLYGLVLWNEAIVPLSVLGIIFIILSGAYATWCSTQPGHS